MRECQVTETAGALADALVATVCDQLEALAEQHAPALALPRVFAGHVVGPDARSDLAFTLGLLAEYGVDELAGVAVEDVALATLRGLDGPATHTFYSYRAAETLRRFGGYDERGRLASWSEEERSNLRAAFDSTEAALRLRKGQMPVNFAVVLARCEHAREALGLLDQAALLDELLGRCRELFAATRAGWIDDSNERRGQFDIYTPDMFLFAEPLAERLAPAWSEGLRRVLVDVDSLALPGGAIVWGRSIGALGLAMSVELASVGLSRGLVEDPGAWLARARAALDELASWFEGGVISAHVRRSTMFYRGPARRLQMTLDILGKLVQAALELRQVPQASVGRPLEAWRPVDRVVRFGAKQAGAWAHRDRRLAFVLPLVDGFSSDYLPALRAPGLFECPVSGPASFVPVVHRDGQQLVAGHLPSAVEHAEHWLAVEHEGWSPVGASPDAGPALAGRRRATYRVEGRSLVVDEELELDGDPADIDAVAFQLPERADRPLDVRFETPSSHRVDAIDVAGLSEWRSFWAELSRVHQLDLEPASRLRFRWTVTPQLRVASTAYRHPYDASLYGPLEGRLVELEGGPDLLDDVRRLRNVDILHVHWPEWWAGLDPKRIGGVLERLHDERIRIVWTQHNLRPHRARGEEGAACYRLWAQAADAVIHHTEWGRAQALATYDYAPDTLHRTITHGHWGARFAPHEAAERAEVEAELGLTPCALRIGVVGAPRAEKDVQLVLDAFHSCGRDDMQLLVVSREDEEVPDDPRIRALRFRMEHELVYYRRLVAIDVLAFPFAAEGMLMTGTAFDAIGGGKAALVSDWPLLHEVLGDAAIPYGSTREDLTACLDALTQEQVAQSAAAARALRPRYEWDDIAAQTIALLEEVAARP